MPRLFVALDPPEPIKARLEQLCCGLPGARWVQERQFHLTLAFLGEVEGPAAERITEGLSSVRAPPFPLELAGVGTFPTRAKPRVLWVGVRPSEPLMVLQKRVVACLKRVGASPEQRRFHPHVTLARLKDPAMGPLVEFLSSHAAWGCEPFPVRDFRLVRSRLGRAGALYTPEACYPLISRRPPAPPEGAA